MNLIKVLEAAGLNQKTLVRLARERLDGSDRRYFDRPMLSKFSAGGCLPTPNQLRAICEIADSSPDEIYMPDEIDLAGCMSAIKQAENSAGQSGRKNIRTICVRVKPSIANALKRALKRKGVTLTSWIIELAEKEIEEYKKSALE